MDNETRQHLRRMVQHASLLGRATAFDRLLVDLQALLDDGDLPAVEAAPVDAVEIVEEAAPAVEAAPVVEKTPQAKPKRKAPRRRRARGRAVEQPAAPVEEAADKAPNAATADVQEVDAPAAVESALGSVSPDESGTLADLFPAGEAGA